MITIVMSLWLVAAAAAAQGPVTIVLPPDVRPADVTVHYFMTGAFGGRGGQVLFPAGPSRYSIVTDVDGKPALTLKLVVFAIGRQTQSIDATPFLAGKREVVVQLPRLATAPLQARVELPAGADYSRFRVIASEMPSWTCGFFGIVDCMIFPVRVGDAAIDAGGTFTMLLDGNVSSLRFALVDRVTGDRITDLGNSDGLLFRPALSRVQPPGVLTGRVTDQYGGVVPGVTITATSAFGEWSTVTSRTGEFQLDLDAAQYWIRARLSGFRLVEEQIFIETGGKHSWIAQIRPGQPEGNYAFYAAELEKAIVDRTGQTAHRCGSYATTATEAQLWQAIQCVKSAGVMRQPAWSVVGLMRMDTFAAVGLLVGSDGQVTFFRAEHSLPSFTACATPGLTRANGQWQFICDAKQ